MKITGYFIPHSESKLEFVQLNEVQYQISDSDTDMDLCTEYGVIDCAKSNSKYIEILNKYSVCELSSNDIINLIDVITPEEIIPKLISVNKDYPNK